MEHDSDVERIKALDLENMTLSERPDTQGRGRYSALHVKSPERAQSKKERAHLNDSKRINNNLANAVRGVGTEDRRPVPAGTCLGPADCPGVGRGRNPAALPVSP